MKKDRDQHNQQDRDNSHEPEHYLEFLELLSPSEQQIMKGIVETFQELSRDLYRGVTIFAIGGITREGNETTTHDIDLFICQDNLPEDTERITIEATARDLERMLLMNLKNNKIHAVQDRSIGWGNLELGAKSYDIITGNVQRTFTPGYFNPRIITFPQEKSQQRIFDIQILGKMSYSTESFLINAHEKKLPYITVKHFEPGKKIEKKPKRSLPTLRREHR